MLITVLCVDCKKLVLTHLMLSMLTQICVVLKLKLNYGVRNRTFSNRCENIDNAIVRRMFLVSGV